MSPNTYDFDTPCCDPSSCSSSYMARGLRSLNEYVINRMEQFYTSEAQVIKAFFALYGTLRFITVLTKAHHLFML